MNQTLFQYLSNNFDSNIHQILLLGVILGFIISVVSGLISGIGGIEIEKKTYANQGIWRSLNNCIILSLVISLLGTLVIFCIEIIRLNLQINQLRINKFIINRLIINSIYSGILLGTLIGLTKSGTPAIKHFILRVLLWSNGYIPWNYAKFLDYSTQRLFLQRVGGGYRFIHDLFRKKFAILLTEENLMPVNNHPQIVQKGKLKNILLITSIFIVIGYTSWSFHLPETNITAYNNQGIAYYNQNEYDKAITDYNQVIELDPKSAYAYHNRGNAYRGKKQYDQAIADYNKAITLDSKSANAYIARGSAYRGKKQYDQAIADYNKAITLDSKSANTYDSRCEAYRRKGDDDHAIADCNQAIMLDSNHTNSYYNRAIAYKNKGIKDKAIEDFRKVLQLNDDIELSQKTKLELQKLSQR